MRVLGPGGVVAFDFPNRLCPWYGPLKRALEIDTHVHAPLFSAGEAKRLARGVGFERVRLRHLLFTSERIRAHCP